MENDLTGLADRISQLKDEKFAKHDAYTNNVEKGEYPSVIDVPLEMPFTNGNGSIQNLILRQVTSVAVITSIAGSVRANHYHKTDWHYAYVISGRVVYFERDIGETSIPPARVFQPGQMFFTRPMKEHAMLFPVDTTIITLAKNVRSHESHESDVVRTEFIPQDFITTLVSNLK